MPSRRIDDRIRGLCARAAVAPDSQVEDVLWELRKALAEHNQRLRKLAAEILVGDGDHRTEKRSA